MRVPLAIIIPVYNEAANIGKTLEAIEKEVRRAHRTYLVYDFEEDDTLVAAERYRGDRGMDLNFLKNRATGVVNAIMTGLREAQGDYLLVTMADLSDDYGVVDRMCALADEGYDVVCGSRYARGGRQIGGPIVKKALSRLAGMSLKYLAGMPVADITNSFKLYRKSTVDALRLESDGGFEIGMEIVVKAHLAGLRVTEVPCCWRDRQEGKSRFRVMKWAPKYLRWYVLALKGRFFKG